MNSLDSAIYAVRLIHDQDEYRRLECIVEELDCGNIEKAADLIRRRYNHLRIEDELRRKS